MQRVFGSIAIFAGWLSLGIGAMAGMAVSQFFGLNHVEGPLPPLGVYGISGAVVLWAFIGAAVLMAAPMAMAMVAPDPQRNLRYAAVAMAIVGVALVPDELGRAFGLPLLAGAACLWAGGELIHGEAVAVGSVAGHTQTPQLSWEPCAAPTSTEPPAATPRLASASPAGSPPQTTLSAVPPAIAATPSPQAPGPTAERGRGKSRKKAKVPEGLCPWCSAAVPPNSESCPSCHAALDATAAGSVSIPGVTEVAPSLQEYDRQARRGKKTSLLSMIFSDPPLPGPAASLSDSVSPSDAAAVRPPSPELRAEMARLDAEIAAGLVPLGTPSEDSAGGSEVALSAGGPEVAQPTDAATPVDSTVPAGSPRAPRRRKPLT